MRIRRRTATVAAVGMLTMAIASTAQANKSEPETQDVAVNAVSTNGLRELTLLAADGATGLGALSLGTAGQTPFGVNVTDILHANVGYQVSAKLTHLYGYDPAEQDLDCGSFIPATALGIEFLDGNPTVAASLGVVQPVFEFSGDLTGAVDDALYTTLSLLVGDVALDDALTVTDVPVVGTLYEHALSASPIDIAHGGNPGRFNVQMAHADCGHAPSTTIDPIVLQEGTPNATVVAAVLSEIDTAISTSSDGAAATTHVNDGLVEEATLIAAVKETVEQQLNAALQDAGVVDLSIVQDVLADLTSTEILSAVTGTLVDVGDLLGQTGTYFSVPTLTLDRDAVTVPAGPYRGTMEVTIVDVP